MRLQSCKDQLKDEAKKPGRLSKSLSLLLCFTLQCLQSSISKHIMFHMLLLTASVWTDDQSSVVFPPRPSAEWANMTRQHPLPTVLFLPDKWFSFFRIPLEARHIHSKLRRQQSSHRWKPALWRFKLKLSPPFLFTSISTGALDQWSTKSNDRFSFRPTRPEWSSLSIWVDRGWAWMMTNFV